jgi:transcriptional regulator with XRE-family HTH domain
MEPCCDINREVSVLKELGDYLRQAREKQNISLKDIQEATKIRLRYLEAIEQGDLAVIPGEVYRKGFIVNYAETVGLDGQAVLQKYYELSGNKAESGPVQPSNEETATANQDPVLEKGVKSGDHSRSNLSPVLVWFGVVVLAGAILFFVFFNPAAKKDPPARATAAVQPRPSPVAQEVSPASAYPSPIYVEADFIDRVWVRVNADGSLIFSEDGRTFDPKDGKQFWSAQTEMEIRLGNPLGVRLSLNGKYLGQLGKYGEPVTVKLTPDGIVAP